MKEEYQHEIQKIRQSDMSANDKAKYIRAWRREAFMDKFLHSELFVILISITTTVLTTLLVIALLAWWQQKL